MFYETKIEDLRGGILLGRVGGKHYNLPESKMYWNVPSNFLVVLDPESGRDPPGIFDGTQKTKRNETKRNPYAEILRVSTAL